MSNMANQHKRTWARIRGAKKVDPIYRPERPGDIRHSRLDNRRAKELLNWSPGNNLTEGLNETIRFFAAKKSIELIGAC